MKHTLRRTQFLNMFEIGVDYKQCKTPAQSDIAFAELKKRLRKSSKPKHHYYLFGEEACMIFDEGYGMDKLIDEIANHEYSSYAIYKHSSEQSPTYLLQEANGWADCIEITSKQYNAILKASKP